MELLSLRELAWCEIDGQLVFLDIAADRYFRLPELANREALAEIDRRGLARSRQPGRLPLPADWSAPARTSPAIQAGEFRLGDVARAMWTQKRVEARLARRSLSSILFELRAAIEAHASTTAVCGSTSSRMVRAFEHARLLRTAADRCLPRSIALALCLAMGGITARAAIGVRLAPFAAHSWVQAGDEVLNDSVEEVLRYRPILVV
jgi:hypothetical protein